MDSIAWPLRPLLLAIAGGGGYLVSRVIYYVISSLWSPLGNLPGPPNPSFFWGHLPQIFKEDPAVAHLRWSYEYGLTYRYKGFLNRNRVITLDPKALTYILNHSYDYPKPDELREGLADLLGQGLLFAEGDAHKRQRRVINPSFARPHIRDLTDIFHEKSLQLRDVLNVQLTQSGGELTVNICPWLNKVTLDIIGLAGFGYKFDALNPTGKTNELLVAINNALRGGGLRLSNILRAYLGAIARKIPTRQRRDTKKSTEVMTRIGLDLVHTKKQALLSSIRNMEGSPGQVEKSNISGRDLLSRLLAANMATDLPENQRLSDQEVFSQISTFLVAGHETTATAATWALFALAQSPAVQTKLREELLLVETNTPSMDELNALPYLENVVRETMRLHAPVSSTVRVAARDDLIPLETPYQDRDGVLHHEIPIRKGERLFIPILALNTHSGIWGEDAHVFRPERWENENDTEKHHDIPGIYMNMLTFLAGPRACIGYRFALVELKCILFALIRSFHFELAVPAESIVKKSALVTRPFPKDAPKVDKPQLPLKISSWKST